MYREYRQLEQQLQRLMSNMSSNRTQRNASLSDDTFQHAADNLTNFLDILSDTPPRPRRYIEGSERQSEEILQFVPIAPL